MLAAMKKKPKDRSGLIFVALLCVLVGIVLSIAFLNGDRQLSPQSQDGTLIPRTTVQPQ